MITFWFPFPVIPNRYEPMLFSSMIRFLVRLAIIFLESVSWCINMLWNVAGSMVADISAKSQRQVYDESYPCKHHTMPEPERGRTGILWHVYGSPTLMFLEATSSLISSRLAALRVIRGCLGAGTRNLLVTWLACRYWTERVYSDIITSNPSSQHVW